MRHLIDAKWAAPFYYSKLIWKESAKIKEDVCSHLHDRNPLGNCVIVYQISKIWLDIWHRKQKIIRTAHDFLSDTTHGNRGVKYYIKETNEQGGENKLYGTVFSLDVGIGMRERVLHRTLSNPQKQKVQKNALEGISFLPNSKHGQSLSQG